MKRIALVVLLMTLAAAVFGQSAGSVLLSGGTNGNISADVFGEDTSRQWVKASFYGLGGYFIVDGIEVGPYISLSWESGKRASNDTTEQNRDAYLGLQAGYFLVTGTRFTPFVQLLAAYRMAEEMDKTGDVTTYESSWTALMVQLRAGLEIMLTDSVALAAGTCFQYYKDPRWDGSFNLRAYVGLDVFLGPFQR